MMGNPKPNSLQIVIGLILVNPRLLFFEIVDSRTDFSYISDANCKNSLSIVSVKSNPCGLPY